VNTGYLGTMPNKSLDRSHRQRASHQTDPVLSWRVLAGGGPVNSAVMRVDSAIQWSIVALVLLSSIPVVTAAQSKAPRFNQVTITIKTEGGPTMCMAGVDYCLPAYVVSVNETGLVKYFGVGGVKIKGERTHSISPSRVRDLVADFMRINFFSLEDEYRFKRLPDGTSVGIDHTNATTISIDLDGKQKSVYIFFGEPDELKQLKDKLFDALQIDQYVKGAPFTPTQNKSNVPDGWKQIAICRLRFFAPGDIKDLGDMGADTCRGRFANNDIAISLVYGRYLAPAVQGNSDLEFKEELTSIDGRNARVFTYIDASHSNTGLYYNASLYVDVEESEAQGLPKQISLVMFVRGERKKDQETALTIFRTIRFK
jgi:hypothetical protein